MEESERPSRLLSHCSPRAGNSKAHSRDGKARSLKGAHGPRHCPAPVRQITSGPWWSSEIQWQKGDGFSITISASIMSSIYVRGVFAISQPYFALSVFLRGAHVSSCVYAHVGGSHARYVPGHPPTCGPLPSPPLPGACRRENESRHVMTTMTARKRWGR